MIAVYGLGKKDQNKINFYACMFELCGAYAQLACCFCSWYSLFH